MDKCVLLCKDCITLSLRKGGSEWGKYPAEYSDMEMMYHHILMNELNLITVHAEYSIHGLKHFLITAATQLEVDRTTIEKLGHWHHGSNMPDKYNQSKCVQELMCRTAIQQQFAAGWRPVGGCELANEWIQLDDEFERWNEELPKKKVLKSVHCKFSQAKLKLPVFIRRAKKTGAHDNCVKRKIMKIESCKLELLLEQVENLVEKTELDTVNKSISADVIDEAKIDTVQKSVSDIKKDVSKKYQTWIHYPESIKHHKFRVVMNDSKTH